MRFFPLLLLSTATLLAQTSPPQVWVEKSNQNAQVLLNILAKYAPEGAGSLGISGLDDKISIPAADAGEHFRRDTEEAMRTLRSRLATEQDPLVKQDLEILITAGESNIRSSRANEKYMLPYVDIGRSVFQGLHSLLDEQIAPERRPAAIIRLRRYTGLEPGYIATTELAENIFREKRKTPGLLGPAKAEVESDLNATDAYITGIGLLFEKYQMRGYAEAYAKLKEQLIEYKAFVRQEVLPTARADFRLPTELYNVRLDGVGVDYTQADLTALAHRTFTEIQGEMKPLAAKIAMERHLASADYRDVIRELKKEQIPADQVMAVYHERLAQIETIILREHLITLPSRPCIIRVASAAETAQQPAPHMVPPPLINNHAEQGQFVLPGGTVGADGKALKYDDFTFSAAAWTLTAHEGRPGHELQFAAMVERGVSRARAVFAFNSTNVEGWGLYSEWVMLPYMSDEGKLISLQHRLMRATRAFVDPELQQGKLTPEQVLALLQKEVGLSKALATEEVDRYTFRAPGQAVSYFDGYSRLRELRADTEKAMGSKFNAQRFHDFILSQGLLPPSLLRKAVMGEFVGKS